MDNVWVHLHPKTYCVCKPGQCTPVKYRYPADEVFSKATHVRLPPSVESKLSSKGFGPWSYYEKAFTSSPVGSKKETCHIAVLLRDLASQNDWSNSHFVEGS
ncbi:hypothetical protein CDAR_547091 [Caerostris darwini]|uniref:Uncharacterized protein n=1 Tax=Caerostris darwini TaxID=1538125 RepID=A0AAV4U0Z1_9ARAC|nr:hypothetical protein CDAR_547091 [Caerostris darwini]